MTEKDMAFETLQSLCMEATKKFGIAAFVNIIGGQKQYVAAGFMPSEVAPPMSIAEGSGMALNVCKISTPRKVSVCQHVVHQANPIVFEGLQNHPCPAAMEDLAAASKVDDELAGFLSQMQNNDGYSTQGEGDAFKMKVAMDFFNEAMSSPDTFFYAGIPIRVDGQAVGSFCLLGASKPTDWKDGDITYLENLAMKASLALERQSAANMRAKAQEAMMTQMMQMQMQMMQQMQQNSPGATQMPMMMPMMMPTPMQTQMPM